MNGLLNMKTMLYGEQYAFAMINIDVFDSGNGNNV
jgi:hypothetical protein